MSTIEAFPFSPSQAVIVARMVVPIHEEIPAEVAKYLTQLKFPDADVTRMNELSAKARAGVLSTDEQQQLDDYEYVGLVLERIKSQARQRLKQESG